MRPFFFDRMIESNIVMLCFLLMTGPLGVILNVAFITLTLRKRELRKSNYAAFLCGMSIANLSYCSFNSVPQVVAILRDLDPNSDFCQLIGMSMIVNGVNAVFIKSLLELSRFVALYYSQLHGTIFSPRNNVIMILFTCLLWIALSVVLHILGDLGRTVGTVCAPNIERMPIGHFFIFASPLVLSYCISIFCAYKILFIIRNQQAAAVRLRLGSRLQDGKDIFRLICIELAVPTMLEMPALVMLLLTTQVYIPPVILTFFIGLFFVHPVLDPVIIVFVLKPYRTIATNIWSSVRGSNNNAVQTITLAVSTKAG